MVDQHAEAARRMTKRTATIALLLALACIPTPAHAQSDGITAEVDRVALSTDEVLTLTVTVETDSMNPPPPDVPPLDGFEILGSGGARQIEIVNGRVQSRAIYTYQLRPLQLGRLTIPPFGVELKGQTFRTDPVVVEATAGSAPTPAQATAPPPGSSVDGSGGAMLRVEASAQPARPYLGQAVLYTFQLIRAASLQLPGNIRYQAPGFTGFWNQFQPEQSRRTIQTGGRMELVTELRTVVFPTAPGPVTIGAATLTLPGGFTRRGVEVSTESVPIDVRPLPPGAPDGFGGAVGQYRIDAAVDRNQGTVDEPFTLQVTIGGEGNIDALSEPEWPALPQGWRALPGKSSANSEARSGRVTGARRYERLLVPTVPGVADIPAIPYVYFDPTTERYVTIASQPIQVAVLPAAGAAGAGGADASGAADATVPPGAAVADASPGIALRPDKPLAAIAAIAAATESDAQSDAAAEGDARPSALSDAEILGQAASLAAGGDFDDAARLYDDVVGRGMRDGAAYFNLGNAWHAAGERGRAVLALARAARLAPRDADIRHNRAAVLADLPPELAASPAVGWRAGLGALQRWISLAELRRLAVLALCLVIAAMIVRRLDRSEGRKRLAGAAWAGAVATAAVGGIGEALWRYDARTQPAAIVIADRLDVSDGPGGPPERYTVTDLPAGVEVRVLERRGDWARIAWPGTEFDGWVAADGVEAIEPWLSEGE